METTKLVSKGQIVLPKPLRPLRPFPPTRLEDIAGSLPFRGKPKSLGEMRKAIAAGVKERCDRGRY